MKKLFLVAALGVAGLLSAKNTAHEKLNSVGMDFKVQKAKKSTFIVTTSCGNSYIMTFPDSWNLVRIINYITAFDDGNCAN